LKGVSNSLTSASNWIANFGLSFMFPIVTSTASGKVLAYITLGICCFILYFYMKANVAETKGKSNEECILLF